MKIEEYVYNGYKATVIIPDEPNGKWIWKTEFLYAFDQAEVALVERGYIRVNYEICDKYGSYDAVRLMHDFHKHFLKKYSIDTKPVLFGFSRGGLYAFNYALFYPEYVDKVYLDAPVLDMKTWPWANSSEQKEMFREYALCDATLPFFKGNPIDNLAEFFSHDLPLLVVAGGADEVVPFERNSGKLLSFAKLNGISVKCIIKPDCKHHPHSLDDVAPIIEFVEG